MGILNERLVCTWTSWCLAYPIRWLPSNPLGFVSRFQLSWRLSGCISILRLTKNECPHQFVEECYPRFKARVSYPIAVLQQGSTFIRIVSVIATTLQRTTLPAPHENRGEALTWAYQKPRQHRRHTPPTTIIPGGIMHVPLTNLCRRIRTRHACFLSSLGFTIKKSESDSISLRRITPSLNLEHLRDDKTTGGSPGTVVIHLSLATYLDIPCRTDVCV